jgi:hypothetical protein
MPPRIPLDPGIRDWVLVPIIVVLFCFALLRHYATILLRSSPKVDTKQVSETTPLLHCKLLENAYFIPLESFRVRYEAIAHPHTGALHKTVENTQMANMMDPSRMGDMMKQNVTGILPNIAMMGLVSYFFSGVIIAKFPFHLSERFRDMLQRGIELNTLDVSYVTGLSMYFLMFFGQRGIVALLLGESSEADDTQLMQQQMGQAQAAQGLDLPKLYKQGLEDAHIAKAQYTNRLDEAEDKMLSMKF